MNSVKAFKKNVLYFLFVVFLLGCTNEPTHEELLAKDKEKLQDAVECYEVNKYKFIKICLRASRVEDTTMVEYVRYKNEVSQVMDIISGVDFEGSLSPLDMLK